MSEWQPLREVIAQSVGAPFRNWRAVLRIFIVPMVLLLAVASAAGLAFPSVVQGAETAVILTYAAIKVVVLVWVSVAWHRFVLLDEAPRGLLPSVPLLAIPVYLGLLLLLGVPSILLFFRLVVLGAVAGSLAILLFFPALFVGALFYRLSPLLPAVAIGRPIGPGAVWRATAGGFGLCVMVFFLMLMAVVLFIAIGRFAEQWLPVLATVVISQVLITVSIILHVSLMTALYAYYVEEGALRESAARAEAALSDKPAGKGRRHRKSLGAQVFNGLRYAFWFFIALAVLGALLGAVVGALGAAP